MTSQLHLIVLVLAASSTKVLSVLPVPCTDLRPIYLLQDVIGNVQNIPPGVEIVYDGVTSTHAYKFSSLNFNLHYSASSIFKYCDFFPEEFSILITAKITRSMRRREQCILSVIPFGRKLRSLSIRMNKDSLVFDYSDHRRQRSRSVIFEDVITTGWNTYVISVSGDVTALRVNCGKPKIKEINRVFPAFLSVRDANFHIGNCNKKSTIFKGLLRQLLILPGSDASRIACPSTEPLGPDYYPHPYPAIDRSSWWLQYHRHSPCTWRDTGRLWFDVYKKTLNVCFSGIWQAVLPPPEERKERKLDYMVPHQDLVTAAPCIDIEVFRIQNEGLFMATASFSESRDLRKQQSAIFKWERDKFRVYQSVYTLGAQSWEFFIIDKQYFLAVANNGPNREKASKSVIYRWHRKRKRFRVHQELITWTARDIEYFRIAEEHFLAVANHVIGQNHSIPSAIYRWDSTENKFKSFQDIVTVGAYDWTYFQVVDYHFLAVANSFTGPLAETSTTRTESNIYFWEKGKFLLFQSLTTTGATDWEYFRIGDEVFLVVANAFIFDPSVEEGTDRFHTNSTIYQLNKYTKQFQVYQQLRTYSVVDWEAFGIGEDTYLIASNAQQAGRRYRDGPVTWDQLTSVYRWQGVEKFVKVHELDIRPSADWEVFTVNGNTFLAYANARDNVSQVLKLKML